MHKDEKRHKVIAHHWKNGRLTITEYITLDLEVALEILNDLICESFKIFDWDGNLVHSGHSRPNDDCY